MQNGTNFNAEELKARFNPEGSMLRRHQLVMLDMVKVLDQICKKHNIPFFLYGGTLLGAIRHNGFIPWDDDLDLGIMRKDYLRLLKILPNELPENISLQTNDTDRNYFLFVAKLRDKKSFIEEASFDKVFKERGIFIDIFPLDHLLPWSQRLKLQSLAYNIFRSGDGNASSMRKVRALTWFNRHISFPMLRLMSRLCRPSSLMCDYGIPFHNIYDERDVFPLQLHDFEGLQLPIPANSHNMLRTMYGDYMRLPDDLDNVYHHVEQLEIFDD